jgi:hypothetical protein
LKRLTTILLTALLLLHVLGYYGVFLGLQYQNSQALVQRLDNDTYNTDETVTLRIPLSVPYVDNDAEYQRVDGEFEHEGELYHMVKQRLSNDTLFVVCVKDHQGSRIGKALKDYVKTFADNKASDGKAPAKTLTSFSKDYMTSSYSIAKFSQGWYAAATATPAQPKNLEHTFCASIIHPPERG